MLDFFNTGILTSIYEVMIIIQSMSMGIMRFFGVLFVFFGLIALALEADERSHSRIFKRGYGWGATMIMVGILFGVIEWFTKLMVGTFVGNNDPLILLSSSTDTISELNELDLSMSVLAGYLSLLGFFFLISGLMYLIKASHRQEQGVGAAGKFFVSGIALMFFAGKLVSYI